VVALGEADGATPIRDLLAAGEAIDRPRPELDPVTAVGLLPYSSGTTGLPKGVLLTQANLVTSVRQVGSGLRVGQRDTLLAVPPFSHVMGFLVTLAVRCARAPPWSPCPASTPAGSWSSWSATGSPSWSGPRRCCGS
jgi:acyl-coenzyme A synthetase/AMP-(fatty) acid ligase